VTTRDTGVTDARQPRVRCLAQHYINTIALHHGDLPRRALCMGQLLDGKIGRWWMGTGAWLFPDAGGAAF